MDRLSIAYAGAGDCMQIPTVSYENTMSCPREHDAQDHNLAGWGAGDQSESDINGMLDSRARQLLSPTPTRVFRFNSAPIPVNAAPRPHVHLLWNLEVLASPKAFLLGRREWSPGEEAKAKGSETLSGDYLIGPKCSPCPRKRMIFVFVFFGGVQRLRQCQDMCMSSRIVTELLATQSRNRCSSHL